MANSVLTSNTKRSLYGMWWRSPPKMMRLPSCRTAEWPSRAAGLFPLMNRSSPRGLVTSDSPPPRSGCALPVILVDRARAIFLLTICLYRCSKLQSAVFMMREFFIEIDVGLSRVTCGAVPWALWFVPIVRDFFAGEERLLFCAVFLPVLLKRLMVWFLGEPPPAAGVSNSDVLPDGRIGDFAVWLRAEVVIFC